jgi:hypothetical protein
MTIGPRLKDAEYDSLALLLAAYESHSYGKGYGVILSDSQGLKRLNKLGRRVAYRCDRWGKPQLRKNQDLHKTRKRAHISSRKCNCPFIIKAQELSSSKWRGLILEAYYNHMPSIKVTSHPSYQKHNLKSNKEAKALVY